MIYLKHRNLIKISGSENKKFLNSVLTSDIDILILGKVFPSALLSPQGRILFDILISLNIIESNSDFPSILIETHVSQRDELYNKLKLYSLRKDVIIEKTNLLVFVDNNDKQFKNSLSDTRFIQNKVNRIYAIKNNFFEEIIKNKSEMDWYDLFRFKDCIPEGPSEIIHNKSLPLEVNLDIIDGVSFKKGCFIGQEVTARTKWRGLIKKKYVPIEIENLKEIISINQDNDIIFENIKIGELINFKIDTKLNHVFGIASIKMKYLYKFEKDNSLRCYYQNFSMKIMLPNHLLPLPSKT